MRLIFSLLGLLATPGLAAASDLVDVYDLAVQNDTQLAAQGHALDAALQSKPIARSSLLPQLSGSGSYSFDNNKTTSTVTFDQTTGQEIPPTSFTRTSYAEPYSYGLNLNQILFDREAWVRLKQSDDRAASARADYAAAQQDLVLRVSQAYFDVLAAQDSLRFSKAENEAVSRQLEQSRQRFDVGLAAITDVQEAQARYDLTVANALQAEQDLATARQALAQIIRQRELPLARLRDEIPLPKPDPADADAWVDAANEGNLTLLSARIQSEIAHKDIKISKSGHYPTLNLQGTKRYSQSGGYNDSETDSDSVSLNLNVPIFSGLGVRADVRRASSVYEQRRSELEGTERQVERDTRVAYQGVITGSARVKALKQAVVSNQTAYEASDVGLQVGTRTNVDVLDAQQQLYSAQRDYARARYDYLISVLQLKAAAGRLGENDLVEINRLLIDEN